MSTSLRVNVWDERGRASALRPTNSYGSERLQEFRKKPARSSDTTEPPAADLRIETAKSL
jgi:hypothetical protein